MIGLGMASANPHIANILKDFPLLMNWNLSLAELTLHTLALASSTLVQGSLVVCSGWPDVGDFASCVYWRDLCEATCAPYAREGLLCGCHVRKHKDVFSCVV